MTVEHVKLNQIKLGSWLDYFQNLWNEQSETLKRKGLVMITQNL
jgi:hypothetical protein